MEILNLLNSKQIHGDKKLITENHDIIDLLTKLSPGKIKNLIANIYNNVTQDCHANKTIESEKFNILGIGGFGIIFEIKNNMCLKLTINLNHDSTVSEYHIPNILGKNKNLAQLINIPLCLLCDVNITGLENYLRLVCALMLLSKNCKMEKETFSHEIQKIKKNLKLDQDQIARYLYIYKTYVKLPHLYLVERYDNVMTLINRFQKEQKKKIFIFFNKAIDSANHFIRERIEDSNNASIQLRSLFLQASLFLLLANEHYFFVHHDFKPDNILVFKQTSPYVITYKEYAFEFDIGVIYKVNDFSFSRLKEHEDKHNYLCLFYDIHFFTHFFFYYFYKTLKKNDPKLLHYLHKTYIESFCNQDIDNVDTLINIKKSQKHSTLNLECKEGKIKKYVKYTVKDLENDILKNDLFKMFLKN